MNDKPKQLTVQERNDGTIDFLRSALNSAVTLREKIEGFSSKDEQARATQGEKPKTYLFSDQNVINELSRELDVQLSQIHQLLGY